MISRDKCDNALMKECFFEILANSTEDYACKICRAAGSAKSFKCRANAGYTNLMNHLKGVHKDTWGDVFKKFKGERLGKKRGESSNTIDGYMMNLYAKKP